MSTRLLVFIAGTILAVAGALAGFSESRPDAAAKAPARPKLVILLTIDQFRNDFLDRFRPYFVAGGFNRLMGGARFTNCRYDYATTVTGPGHATIATGAYPNVHGIIGNAWYDRKIKRMVNCVEDLNTRVVATAEGSLERRGASPRSLTGSTVGDELRMATDFRSKVISISLKDRGAVLPGGHTANAAYWYDGSTAGFVSSTYYMEKLPAWVAAFNAQNPAREFCGKPWKALAETPGAEGRTFSEYRLASGEACPSPRFLDWLDDTPFTMDVELRFAREAIRQEKLGQGSGTDMLALSISTNDFVGHRFGPYGPEVADLTLRTDRALASFIDDLDRIVGLENVWIAFTADHGASPTPQYIREKKLGLGLFKSREFRDAVEAHLSRTFGEDKWVETFDIPYIYLNQGVIAKHQVSSERVSEEAAQGAMNVPGIFAAFGRSAMLSGSAPKQGLARKVFNSLNLSNGGDVFIVLEPYTVASGSDTSASHGTPWSYDALVPLIFWGSAFRHGEYAEPCEPVDLAPTLSQALGVNLPSGSVGTPLSLALTRR